MLRFEVSEACATSLHTRPAGFKNMLFDLTMASNVQINNLSVLSEHTTNPCRPGALYPRSQLPKTTHCFFFFFVFFFFSIKWLSGIRDISSKITLVENVRLPRPLRPSQGFWGFREKGFLFSGIWGEGSFILRNFGRKHNFLGFSGAGSRGLRKNILGS